MHVDETEDLDFGNRSWITTERREKVREYLRQHGVPDLKAKRELLAAIGGSMFSIRNNILLITAETDPNALRLAVRNKFRAIQMRVRNYTVIDTLTTDELLAKFVSESGRCSYCSGKFFIGDVCFDHVRPMGYRGPNSISNIQILCLPCHVKKAKEDQRWKREAKEDGKTLSQVVIERLNQ